MGRPRHDGDLVARARAGDRAAFADIVREHQEIAFRTAFLITRNAADAEEAAQDGFVKAHRALGRFRLGEPFRPWLLAIVANEARNRLRTAGRREALAVRAGREAASGDPARSPEAILLDRERRETLARAIDRLRDEDRLVLGCRYLLGLTEAEAAAALGWRVGTVKSRTSRALDRLRAELGERP